MFCLAILDKSIGHHCPCPSWGIPVDAVVIIVVVVAHHQIDFAGSIDN
jgi:hypothetical protein